MIIVNLNQFLINPTWALVITSQWSKISRNSIPTQKNSASILRALIRLLITSSKWGKKTTKWTFCKKCHLQLNTKKCKSRMMALSNVLKPKDSVLKTYLKFLVRDSKTPLTLEMVLTRRMNSLNRSNLSRQTYSGSLRLFQKVSLRMLRKTKILMSAASISIWEIDLL